jgi:2-polyprenyl-3-methyl-5-hydroxy-6-metoxy-1,4-benzoquinol methylase
MLGALLNNDLSHCKKVVNRVTEVFREKHGFSKDIAVRAEKMFGDEWTTGFGRAVDTLFGKEEDLTCAVNGYAAFAIDSLRRQKKFELERKYEVKSHKQAAEEVYFNEKHMLEQYLPGLFLSHYLWPHHYRQLKYFKEFFVSSMKQSNASRFVEVGIGTGVYSRILLQEIAGVSGVGFDISEHSKTFTENHLKAFGLGGRYEVHLQDVLENTPQDEFNWLVCVEVLEHLENPLQFLRGLREMLAPGGKAFITAALNAANEDHIYLYENTGQVFEQLQEAGFVPEQYFYGAAYAPASPDLPVPAVVAFIVT